MNAQSFFQSISGRYGISVDALMDAWNKTRADSHEMHVKKFKLYLHKITGQDYFGLEIPKMPDQIAESVAQVFLAFDFEQLKDCALEELNSRK